MVESDYTHLEGIDLGEAEATVSRQQAFLWAEATRNDEPAYRWPSESEDRQLAPPGVAYLLIFTADGLNRDMEELGLDPDFEKGHFLAGHEFTFHQPLYVGEPYHITGELTDVTRKETDTSTFDIHEQAFEATDSEGEPAYDLLFRGILMR